MSQAGAHHVVDGIADVPPLIDAINARLARGERPWYVASLAVCRRKCGTML
jgi:hypothetical protein